MNFERSQASSLEGRRSDVDTAWRERANCTGDTTLFFAKKAERPEARARREAKALRLCNDCEVRLVELCVTTQVVRRRLS